jgi:hypothetical protein
MPGFNQAVNPEEIDTRRYLFIHHTSFHQGSLYAKPFVKQSYTRCVSPKSEACRLLFSGDSCDQS